MLVDWTVLEEYRRIVFPRWRLDGSRFSFHTIPNILTFCICIYIFAHWTTSNVLGSFFIISSISVAPLQEDSIPTTAKGLGRLIYTPFSCCRSYPYPSSLHPYLTIYVLCHFHLHALTLLYMVWYNIGSHLHTSRGAWRLASSGMISQERRKWRMSLRLLMELRLKEASCLDNTNYWRGTRSQLN